MKKAQKYFKPINNTKEKYYDLVKKFNAQNLKVKSEMFIYLNKHCFNGLMRFNNSGGFNTPYGSYAGPKFPIENLQKMCEKIRGNDVNFLNADFKILLEDAKFGDIIYCDPPYVDAFTQYGKGGFTMEDQQDLADLAKKAAIRGAKVVVSNHYNKETKKLYKDASYWEIFDVKRSISSNGQKRDSKKEIIAVYDF